MTCGHPRCAPDCRPLHNVAAYVVTCLTCDRRFPVAVREHLDKAEDYDGEARRRAWLYAEIAMKSQMEHEDGEIEI